MSLVNSQTYINAVGFNPPGAKTADEGLSPDGRRHTDGIFRSRNVDVPEQRRRFPQIRRGDAQGALNLIKG